MESAEIQKLEDQKPTKPPGFELPTNLPPLPGVGIDILTLGRLLAASGYFQDARALSQSVTKVLAGQELGIGPIRSMTDIHVITTMRDGEQRTRIGMSAVLMASLVQRSDRFRYEVKELSDQACELVFHERLDGKEWRQAGPSRFTMADAERAKLIDRNPTYKTYPRNMLFARAMSNGARWFCAAVFGGPVYTPEELRDIEEEPAATPARPGEVVEDLRPFVPPIVDPPPSTKSEAVARRLKAKAQPETPSATPAMVPTVTATTEVVAIPEAPADSPAIATEPDRPKVSADLPEADLRERLEANIVALGIPGREIPALLDQITGKRAAGEFGPDDYVRAIRVIEMMLDGKGLGEATKVTA